MMPPADDEAAFASTGAGSMTGSAMPPAKAVVAAIERAAASAIFFIVYVSIRAPANELSEGNWGNYRYLVSSSSPKGEIFATPHLHSQQSFRSFRQISNTCRPNFRGTERAQAKFSRQRGRTGASQGKHICRPADQAMLIADEIVGRDNIQCRDCANGHSRWPGACAHPAGGGPAGHQASRN